METFYNDVNEWLAVGADLDIAQGVTGQTPDEVVHMMRAGGITHVLDLRSEWGDKETWVAGGLDEWGYLRLPIIDNRNHSPAEWWYEGVEDFVSLFLADRKEGDRLYAHCHMGINRGPSAAMLALLTADPSLHPYNAFRTIRDARDIAGLVYAEHVGHRHFRKTIADDTERWGETTKLTQDIEAYWSSERWSGVHRGIAYYRSVEGGTLTERAG